MTISQIQRQKAAEAMAELLPASTEPEIEYFKKILMRELPDDMLLFGCYYKPDRYLANALKKAKYLVTAITECTIICFESKDRISFFKHGKWELR